MPPKKDKAWGHFTTTESETSGKKTKISLCNYCNVSYTFPNATRLKEHLATCSKCPDDAKLFAVNALKSLKAGSRSKKINDNGEADSDVDNDLKSVEDMQMEVHDQEKQIVPVPKPRTKQSSIIKFVDQTPPEKKKKIDEKIARAIYVSGAPLCMFDNPYWIEVLKELRPSYSVASTYEFSTPLLNAEYTRVMDSVGKKLKSAMACALLTDGWSNLRGEGIINFLVTTPDVVFIKNVVPGQERENAEFLGKCCIEAVEECETKHGTSPDKFVVIVTDNASVMKAMWVYFCERYPHITAIACSAHSLNLLLGDLMKLRTLLVFYIKVKAVIKTVKKKSVVLAVFKSKQGDHGTALSLPPKTRWSYVVICLDSVEANKTALQETVICDPIKDMIPKQVKKDVLNDVFWDNVTNFRNYLKPLHDAIKIVEGDSATLSDVPEVTYNVRTQMQGDLMSLVPFQADELEIVRKQIIERLYHCNLEIHFAANLLDPRYRGQKLDPHEIHSAMDYIQKQCDFLKLDIALVIADLAAYRTKSGFYSRDYLWESAQKLKPSVWWGGLCTSQPLEPLASRILSVPPSSAGAERDWSLQGAIHTKAKNRFKNERVEKLKAVRQNLQYSVNALDIKKKSSHRNVSASNSAATTSGEVGAEGENSSQTADLNFIDFSYSSSSDGSDSSEYEYDSEDEMPLNIIRNECQESSEKSEPKEMSKKESKTNPKRRRKN